MPTRLKLVRNEDGTAAWFKRGSGELYVHCAYRPVTRTYDTCAESPDIPAIDPECGVDEEFEPGVSSDPLWSDVADSSEGGNGGGDGSSSRSSSSSSSSLSSSSSSSYSSSGYFSSASSESSDESSDVSSDESSDSSSTDCSSDYDEVCVTMAEDSLTLTGSLFSGSFSTVHTLFGDPVEATLVWDGNEWLYNSGGGVFVDSVVSSSRCDPTGTYAGGSVTIGACP